MKSKVIRTIVNQLTRWERELRQQWGSPLTQFRFVLLLLIIFSAIGILFYRAVLHWSLRQSILQIVLTISTLGGSANPSGEKTPQAEWFSIFFILTILFIVLWAVSVLIQAIVSGDLVYFLGARRMEKRIEHLSNHYIICGFGRMGQEIARIFTRAKKHFVVIEHNPVQIPVLENHGYLYVQGDEREDEQLIRAGIKHAKGLIAVAQSDEDNVYITLSARVLNPNLYIVSRCVNIANEPKLLRAGANRVVSPYIIGGRRIAQAILRPSVVDFLDNIIQEGQVEMLLEEVTVTNESPICGQRMTEDTNIEKMGVHLLGVTTGTGHMVTRNLENHVFHPGDTLILLGEPEPVTAAIKAVAGRTASHSETVSFT